MQPDNDTAELTNALDRATTRCEDCAPTTRWERRDVSSSAEAWLGTCDVCGSMRVLALGATDVEIEDPLAFFMIGVPRFEAPERPAWQRFYALTLDAPYHLRWTFDADPCEACAARTRVGTTFRFPRGRRSLTLCLSCGFTQVETTFSATGAPIRLTGSRWSPPDPAVKALRESVFDGYRRWNDSCREWRQRTDEEGR